MSNEQLLAAAGNLSEDIGRLDKKVGILVDRDRRRRVQFIILAISVVLDLLLSAGFFYALDRTSQAQNNLKRNSATLYQNCLDDNAKAKEEIGLWTGITHLSASDPNKKPTDPKVLAEFNQLLAHTFVIKDCSKVGTAR